MKVKLPVLIAVFLSLCCAAAIACNVPVFRYALEHWRADPYRVVVFHRGPLSPGDLELIRPLEEEQDQWRGNLVLRTVDVDDFAEPADEQLFAEQESATLPWLVVQYPQHLPVATPVVAGPLNRDAVTGIIDSPARQELVRRLAAGQTAVWLLLQGDDAEQNQAVAARLEEQLKKLGSELLLPELTDSPEDSLLIAGPLEVKFSVLTVSRSDAAEQGLIAMLMHSEPDLAERSEPMVFPVFGRGRALFPLVGAGITPENIHHSAEFLIGPCSCQVKEQNPGFDLLLSADWSELLAWSDPTLVDNAGDPPADGKPVYVPIPSGTAAVASAAAPDVEPSPSNTAWLVGGLVVGLLTITLLAVGLKRR